MTEQDQGDWSGGFWSVDSPRSTNARWSGIRTFKVFQIDVESDTEIGHKLHNDPLDGVAYEGSRDGSPRGDARASSARQRRAARQSPQVQEVWIVYEDNTTAVGVQVQVPGRGVTVGRASPVRRARLGRSTG